MYLNNIYVDFRYLSEDDALHNDFLQLVGGVFWILRNGESYINASTYAECGDTEETGMAGQVVRVGSRRWSMNSSMGSHSIPLLLIIWAQKKNF